MNASYYALIRSDEHGGFTAWVPDFPGIVACAATEENVIDTLTQSARRYLQQADEKGVPRPRASALQELASRESENGYRCVLLLITANSPS